jgi:type IX secretion system PorP/SprF family membrane protein
MKRIITFTFLIFSLGFLELKAQDPQFSQYYAAPLYINPAMAGSEDDTRFILNYRNQWPNLDASFQSVSFSIDKYFDNINSGFGLIVNRDEATGAGYRSQSVGLQYAYELELSENYRLRAGMDLSYVMRDFNFFNLTFGDQFDGQGFSGTTQEQLDSDRLNYFNVSTGFLLYSDKYFIGLSAHNMNRPNQDILETQNQVVANSRLPIRYDLQLGAKIPLDRNQDWRDQYRPGYREKSITPTLLYKRQGTFEQLDLGVYVTYEPVIFGVWYRGIPITPYRPGITNHESLIGLVGFKMGSLAIGYSYDFTISSLAPDSGGAHELSLRYLLKTKQRYGVRRKLSPGLPCPRF